MPTKPYAFTSVSRAVAKHPPTPSDSSSAHSLPSPQPLTQADVSKSRRLHGSNVLTAKKRKSFIRQFVSNLGDPVIRILLAALAIKLLFSFHGGTDWFETAGIALAVFLATLISTLSEYGSESAFVRLREECARTACRVIRRVDEASAPVTLEIPSDDVVVGDTVLLQAGETVPADGILLSGWVLVNQAAMTGESRDVEKKPALGSPPKEPSPADACALFKGCVILSGHGVMTVSSVGDHTFLGKISEEVQTDTRESPLKLRLAKLAHQISRLGYVAAALVALIYLINIFVFESAFDTAVMLSKLKDLGFLFESLFSALTLGLTVLVVAVPEGLPMMIAVVLSSNIKKMVRDKVLVRKPAGIEAAGSMNILFTDKTGTLTEGRLSVGGVMLSNGDTCKDVTVLRQKAPLIFEKFIQAAHLNSLATVGKSTQSDTSMQALGGNATDRALLTAVLPWHKSLPNIYGEVTDLIPFDSTAKFSCAWATLDGKPRFFVKGAPERLLPQVASAFDPNGKVVPADKEALMRKYKALTAAGERVLLIAENTSSLLPTRKDAGVCRMGELTFLCMVILRDKLRTEAAESVAQLRRAGIQVVMMTGDNKDTATAIARSVGILSHKQGGASPYVLESGELSRMTDNEVREALPRLCVVARALPSDKSRLVRIAQEMELVVGMTGDGINDAPALKRADVGFAMGEGTQVAKDAGDIIIMDNNLSSIARAVLYGRTIFKSIRKFITLQLTMNLCAMGVTMICPFIGIDAPVTVVQMLWINLIMDTLGGLAFAGEAPLASYMEEPPKRRDEPILNGYMIHQICFLGGFTVALCLLFLKSPVIVRQFRSAPDDIYLLTAFFVLFIFSSVFNCFNARTDRLKVLSGLRKNHAFCLIMTAVLVIQVIFVYVGGQVLRTAPLTLREMGLTAILAALVFPAELIRKLFWRLKGRGKGF